MHKIQSISNKILKILNILGSMYPVIFILIWSFIDHPWVKQLLQYDIFLAPIKTPEGPVNLGYLYLSWPSKIFGITGHALELTPLLLGILVLRKLFQNYKCGEIFTIHNAQHYKHLGWLFFLQGLLIKPLSEMFMVLSATFANPPGHRYLSLSFGTPNLENVFCGILIIIISWIMSEGYRLQEEQKLTI